MIPEEDSPDLDALDRLVDRELRHLFGRYRPRQPSAEPPASDGYATAAGDAAGARTDQDSSRKRHADNVVRAHPLARPPRRPPAGHLEGLFAREEEAFLANAADWLESRPNADILLDALARRVLGGAPSAAAPLPAERDWRHEEAEAAATPDEEWGDDPETTPPDLADPPSPAPRGAVDPPDGGRQGPPETPGDDPAE